MRLTSTKLLMSGALVAAALAVTALPASAQATNSLMTDSTSANSLAPDSASSSAAVAPTPASKSASPTARMIDEALQRSAARAAKAAQTGVPEAWGSEEPFTYQPSQQTYTAAQQ